jgi:AraC family transcriptional regulator
MDQELTILEESIAALERELGVAVTIVDNQGVFHMPLGEVLLSHWRQSHRKNPVCEIGFCDRCVQHCRHEMNRKAAALGAPYVETCWKGVREIVVPLQKNGAHLGMFYAGAWRVEQTAPPSTLPASFADAHAKLHLWDSGRGQRLMSALQTFAKGLLHTLEEFNALESPAHTRANRIGAYIREYAALPIGVEDLAAHLNLSRSRTSFLLRQLFDKSFVSLLHEERIRRAKTLLVGGEDSLAAIAKRVGFRDEYHFNRVFKSVAGLPPGRFRRGL